MKHSLLRLSVALMILILSTLSVLAQDDNVLIGLNSPAYGVKIKANFPGYSGGWARGFTVSNRNNTDNHIQFGAMGSATNGIDGLNYGFIGKSYNDTYMAFRPSGRKVGIGTTNPAYKLHVAGPIYADGGWVRVSGPRGIYFESYGGGFNMVDNTWIRTYGDKSFLHKTGIMRTDGTFQVGSGGDRFIVNAEGDVGIGTTSPTAELDVAGTGKFTNSVLTGTGDVLRFEGGWLDDIFHRYDGFNYGIHLGNLNTFTIEGDGDVNIGETLLIKYNRFGTGYITTNQPYESHNFRPLSFVFGDQKVIHKNDATDYYIALTDNATASVENSLEPFRINKPTGDIHFGNNTLNVLHDEAVVGIGTTNVPSGYKAAIDGKLIAEEIRVIPSDSWDEVFMDDYDLISIEEKEAFTREHHHLPSIEPEAVVVSEGMDVGESFTELLKEVEEAHLYIFKLNKDLKVSQTENDELRKVIDSLAKDINELKEQINK